MAYFLQKLTARLATLPLRLSASVAEYRLHPPLTAADRHLRVELTASPSRTHLSPLLLRSLGAEILEVRDVKVENDSFAWRGDRALVLVPRGVAPVNVAIACTWRDVRRPLRFPLDFPEALRLRLTPQPIAPVWVHAHAGSATASGVGVSTAPADEFLDAVVSFGTVYTTESLAEHGLTLRLMGNDWARLQEFSRSALVTAIRESLVRLVKLLPPGPRGEIQVRLGSDTDCLSSGSGSSIFANPEWLASSSRRVDGESLLAYQLASLWWGGTIRLLGPSSGMLMKAMRLSLSQCATGTPLGLGDQSRTFSGWRSRFTALLASETGRATVRSMSATLLGCEVHETWFLSHLRAKGLR